MNMHVHKPNWHTIGMRMEHLLHDPRFWAAIALAVLFALIVLASIFGKSTPNTMITPNGPMYPFTP